jgi:hypothetical protein
MPKNRSPNKSAKSYPLTSPRTGLEVGWGRLYFTQRRNHLDMRSRFFF